MDSQKQQAAERIKQANNILVTVSNNPSVDQLAACIGLTLTLNKMGKHATAVYSGATPSTIEFLQPEKTLEKNTDSLRDFIIALDKSKADKLRYKVEDRVVKIFITPYRTSINESDLEFSQGDFNVDVVLAIGVHNQADLDQAITSHGRILHDATVITMNSKPGGELGSINWLDPNASSLSELGAQLIDILDKTLLDGQIATAMLTGIVAETERFSNAKTTPQTMSISAALMGAGANQQLVATKLEEPAVIPVALPEPSNAVDSQNKTEQKESVATKKPDDGTLEITHEENASNKPTPTDTLPEETNSKGSSSTIPVESTPEPSVEEPVFAATSEEPVFTPEPIIAPQIHIDEHGSLSPLEDALPPLPPLSPSQPPSIIRHNDTSKMDADLPTLGNQLPSTEPSVFSEHSESGAMLTASPQTGTMLPGDNMNDDESPSGGMARADSFLVGTGQPAPPPTPVIVSPTPPAPQDAGSIKGEDPSLATGRTLTDIERDVHSAHIDNPVTQLPVDNLDQPATQSSTGPMLPSLPASDNPLIMPPNDTRSLPTFDTSALPQSDLGSQLANDNPVSEDVASASPTLSDARDAVAQAIGGGSPSLDPIQSLNANPVNLPMGNPADAAQPVIQPWTPSEPPIVETPPSNQQVGQAGVTLPQFDPAMFGAQENDGSDPNSPPAVPPPMMPPKNPY